MTDRWLDHLLGRPKDLTDTSDPVNLAEDYLQGRDLNRGRSSTFRKAARAVRIALGQRQPPERRSRAAAAMLRTRAVGPLYYPTRPHLIREVMLATFTNQRTGEQRQELYERIVDRSRYTPDRLREIRGDGRHR